MSGAKRKTLVIICVALICLVLLVITRLSNGQVASFYRVGKSSGHEQRKDYFRLLRQPCLRSEIICDISCNRSVGQLRGKRLRNG